MRGNVVATDLNRKERAEEAVALFTRAPELDPDNAGAMIGIASTRIYQVVNQFQTEGREALLDEAEALISRAMGLAADHICVIEARGAVAEARDRFAGAILADMSVIALNPGEPSVWDE